MSVRTQADIMSPARVLHAQGWTFEAIGRALSVSSNTLYGWFRRAGIQTNARSAVALHRFVITGSWKARSGYKRPSSIPDFAASFRARRTA